MSQDTCCPQFNPAPWDGTTVRWESKKFIKDRVFTFLYVPLNFGGMMRRLDEKVRASEGAIPDHLCLSQHTSKWNMDAYLAVDKEIADAKNVAISGEFFCKVYDGPFQDTRKWCADFAALAKSRNLNIRDQYMWYTTCPKCAKKHGHNFVVLIGKTN